MKMLMSMSNQRISKDSLINNNSNNMIKDKMIKDNRIKDNTIISINNDETGLL